MTMKLASGLLLLTVLCGSASAGQVTIKEYRSQPVFVYLWDESAQDWIRRPASGLPKNAECVTAAETPSPPTKPKRGAIDTDLETRAACVPPPGTAVLYQEPKQGLIVVELDDDVAAVRAFQVSLNGRLKTVPNYCDFLSSLDDTNQGRYVRNIGEKCP